MLVTRCIKVTMPSKPVFGGSYHLHLPDTLDLLQFAYRPNRSTDDAISITLDTALSHLDKINTYARMLFIDYSSAFNTIVHSKLVIKSETLSLDPSCATGSWTP
jgi:hypothetical protein